MPNVSDHIKCEYVHHSQASEQKDPGPNHISVSRFTPPFKATHIFHNQRVINRSDKLSVTFNHQNVSKTSTAIQLSRMRLNLDIWNEIISYLKYPEDESTLRSLALLSRIPSDLALDAIWRNGERFLTIASVINSFATSPDEPILVYRFEHNSNLELEEGVGNHQNLVKVSRHGVFPGFQVNDSANS